MSTNQEKLFGRLLLKNDILQLIKSTDKISVSDFLYIFISYVFNLCILLTTFKNPPSFCLLFVLQL